MFKRVLFPEPDAPKIETISLSLIFKDKSFSI